jgi:catechol 2,3-dioxygenase-like lactoylglutathione lyase family enzyme
MSHPVAVAALDHVVLRCRDPERMLAFYRDVLGCPEERRLDALGLIQLRAGAGLVDLVPGEPAGFDGANVDHFCLRLQTTDLAPVVAHLAAAGVAMIGEPVVRYGATGYGASIYLRDPEGNVVELKAATDAA